MKYAIILLAALALTACGSTGTIEEPLEASTATNSVVPSTSEVEPQAGPQTEPQVPKTVLLEVIKIDNGTIIQVMDKMDAQGCLFEKVALTTSRQWNQFVLKCNEPTEIPTVE